MDDDSPNSINISIRKAINYGFDRKKMIRYLRNNIGTPAEFGFIPMGLPSFTSKIKGYNYQPDLAKKLIADANLPSDHKIILSTTSSYLDICEFIQGEMKEHGLSLEISINPPSTHRQMVATSKLSFFAPLPIHNIFLFDFLICSSIRSNEFKSPKGMFFSLICTLRNIFCFLMIVR